MTHDRTTSGRAAARIETASAVLIGGWFLWLAWRERSRALRGLGESKLRHDARNLAVAALGALPMLGLERPIASRLAERNERDGRGLVQKLPLPPAVRDALAVVLMDYAFYGWHVLTHRVPLLWRLHRAHHLDLDMDASTALRFHAGELTISVLFRTAQVSVIGTGLRALACWQAFLFTSILFHHSDWRLPYGLEQPLSRWIVTPRHHAIHHSVRPEETDSNWSSGLALWDRLHGTFRGDLLPERKVLGVPEVRHREMTTLARVLASPVG